MDGLGDIKQLQQEEKRKGQGIDKMVNPPMVASIEMKNQPASGLPGGVTYVPGFGRERPGFAPAYQVQPNIAELRQDINGVEERIRRTFFNNLFTDISDLKTVRSATEIEARREEKLLMLPVIKRLDKEMLAPRIERTWAIMMRGNLLPEANSARGRRPPNRYQVHIPVRDGNARGRDNGDRAGVRIRWKSRRCHPTIMDNYDNDSTVHIYVDALGADPRILRTDEVRDGVRAHKRQQQAQMAQAQQMATMAQQGPKAQKRLSETQVGGGRSALEQMLGWRSVMCIP
jgi:hypothetical protein